MQGPLLVLITYPAARLVQFDRSGRCVILRGLTKKQ